MLILMALILAKFSIRVNHLPSENSTNRALDLEYLVQKKIALFFRITKIGEITNWKVLVLDLKAYFYRVFTLFIPDLSDL